MFLHWLFLHFVGNQSYVNFWGGIASDIGELTLMSGLVGLYYKHVCHQRHCYRISRHIVNGSPWCNKHHEAQR